MERDECRLAVEWDKDAGHGTAGDIVPLVSGDHPIRIAGAVGVTGELPIRIMIKY